MQNIKYVPDVNYTPEIHRKISRIVGLELSALGGPCYYPKMITYFNDLKDSLKISQVEISEFKKQNIHPDNQWMSIIADAQTVTLLIAIIYFIKVKNNQEVAKLFMTYLALKFQSSLIHKSFSFCNNDIFLMAMEKVSHKHLYKVHKGIPSTVQYLANETFSTYYPIIKSNKLTDKNLILMVYSLRHRLAQSLRSFATVYYEIHEQNSLVKTEDETEDKLDRVADKISMMMTTYGSIDKIALNQSITKSGIRKELGTMIISELANPDYREQLKFIIILMDRMVNLRGICTESKRMSLIRKIESGQKILDHSVKEQILKLTKSIPSSYSLTTIYEPIIIIFFAQYLTLYIKNRIC